MDMLSEGKQKEVKKMSDARLVSKLTQAGYNAEQIEAMDRVAMMNAWAEIVASGKETSAAVGVPSKIGYDPEVEKQRLAWEMKRYEEERDYQRKKDDEEKEYRRLKDEEDRKKKEEEIAIRKKEISLKEAKLKKQEADNALRQKCEDAQLKLKDDELKLRQSELDRQKEKDLKEKERNESIVNKMKIFGDAMRGTAFKMSSDPIELIPFFEHIENLFLDLKVDENIKVKLIRPFLNDRAKALLARMDVTNADKYDLVKNYLLHEFQLSPRVYLERFHIVTRHADETYLLFASRLKGLFDFYVSSRKVKSLMILSH
jgi:hypothetical protein